MLQTKLNEKDSIARCRCDICNSDFFEIIEKGKNKELLCEECKKT